VRDVGRAVRWLLVVVLLVHGVYAGLEVVTGADLWWQLAAGRYMVQHREIPTRDIFSYTFAGAPWFNEEWLTQVLFYGLYSLGGGTLLALFKIVLVMGLLAGTAWIGWRRSGSLVFAVGAAAAAAFVCRPYLDIRPQLFEFVGTLMVIGIVDAYRRGAGPAVLAVLPVTMALWVNLHASYIFGLGVLGLLAGCEIVKAWLRIPDAPMPLRRALGLGVATLVTLLACFVHPEPLKALAFPFVILDPAEAPWRTEIVEWLPTKLFREEQFNPAFFGYFFTAQILVALAAVLAAPRRCDLSDTAVVAVTVALALSARRFVPLFALVSVPFAARNLALLRSRAATGPAEAPVRDRVRGTIVAILALGALGNVLLRAVPDAQAIAARGLFPEMIRADFFPRDAVEFLRLNALPGRLFHLYVWGGYLEWELPERKVFIDGRAQTVYPGSFWTEHSAAEYGYPGWNDVLDRHEVALVLWPTGFAGGRHAVMRDELRRSPKWVCIYDDGHSGVFAHVERGLAWIERFEAFSLLYPDVVKAQLFLVTAAFRASDFDRARLGLQAALRRFPETAAIAQQAEERLVAEARTTGFPGSLFGVGFYRDARGDGAAAAEAYRLALERGLVDPQAAYARGALERLARGGNATRNAGPE